MGAYKQRTLELFRLLDLDRNGYITPSDSEFSALRQQAGAPAALNPEWLIMGFVKEGDANRDRKVSKEELLAFVEKAMVGKTPDTMPAFVRQLTTEVFALMDTEKNGQVSKDQFARYLNAYTYSSSGAEEEFTRLDRDGDGNLTVDELQHATFAYFTDPETDAPQRWLHAAFAD
ncbi:EF-hand domain-containing protein [Streptomyces sp. NPDC087425]|uniref:EF-hand domain-containing protein n=1 Tax=Streptomyces sp. NPDC087425 TaxID=3365787 RepID=UPI00381AADFC